MCASYLQAGRAQQVMKCFEELSSLDPGFDPGEIEKTHAYLAGNTLRLLADSLAELMAGARPPEKLKVVEN